MKAEERRHLKEDIFASGTAKVLGNVAEHRDRWMGGFLALVAVVIIGGGFWFWQSNRSEAGGAELGIAMAIEMAPISPASTLPGATQPPGTYPTESARIEAALAAFQKIADTYGSSNAGLTARYHAASAQLEMGKFDDAQKSFERVQADAGSSIMGPMAKMGRAESLFAAGKYTEAIKAFTELSADRDGPLPVDGVLMQLGRSYAKAGQIDQAKATFKRVVDEFSSSPFADQARQQLAQLG